MTPLVSCVMPTDSRPVWVPKAIDCFLSQTFTDTELVILDSGNPTCMSIIPSHPRIRYITTGEKLSTGAKRNLTNKHARGSVLVHFDDDDWSAPGRIEHQLRFMESTGKQVVGYHELLYFRELDQTGFRYNDPRLRPHCTGTSLCYRRDWWEKHPFENVQVGEDFQFCVTANREGALASCDSDGMIVARSHGANTCTPRFGQGPFQPAMTSTFPSDFLKP